VLKGVKERSETMAANDARSDEHLKRAAEAGMTVDKYLAMKDIEKRERASLDELSSYGKRMEEQEEVLADWEQRAQDAFIFGDEQALKAM
jgi:hypothetical protein